MKTSGKILVVLAVLVLVVVLAKNVIVETAVTKAVEKATGFSLEVQKIEVGIFKQTFGIAGLKLRNPPDFPEPDAFDINRLYVRYDLMSFLTATVHLREVVIDIPQVVMVLKVDGESNLDRMKTTASKRGKEPGAEGTEAKTAPPTPEPSPAPKEKKAKGIQIDSLVVKIGKAEVRDYARGSDGKPKVTTYDVAIDKTFTNINGVQSVVNQIVNQILIEGSLQAVSAELKKSGASGKLQDTFQKIGKGLGGLFKKKDAGE